MPSTATAYDARFFAHHGARSERSASVVLPLAFALAPHGSILDLGCGVGTWLAAARALGVDDVLGVDGDYVDGAQLRIDPASFVTADLTRPWRAGRRFDLVLSLEVAEHLPAEAADVLVGTIAAHGDVALFSAAVPLQGGTAHVNEQWPAYWAERFAREGFVAVDCLRRRIWNDDDVAWWYRQNVVFYVREAALPSLPALARAHAADGGIPLALVHPQGVIDKARHAEALRRRSLLSRLLARFRDG